MDENLAPKRKLEEAVQSAAKILKLDHGYSLAANCPPTPNFILLPVPYFPSRKLVLYQMPGAKLPILFYEDDEHPHAYTRLPPEILLDIFDYLKPEDDCMKHLSVVCKKFYNLSSLKLRLELDLDMFNAGDRYQSFRRAYTEIRISGSDFYCHREEIGKSLEKSKETARKLTIDGSASVRTFQRRMKRPLIKMRTLMFVLRSFPNLVEIEIRAVEGLLPQISSKAIKPDEQPELRKLKKLAMLDVPFVICSAFAKADNIEELRTRFKLLSKNELESYREIVAKQKSLQMLDSNATLSTKIKHDSAWFDVAVSGNDIGNLLDKCPKLEHLKLHTDYPFSITQAQLTAGPPVTSLKTIKIYYMEGPFDIEQILKKFPSLEIFKSRARNWTAGRQLSKRTL